MTLPLLEIIALMFLLFMLSWTAYSLPALIVGVRQIRIREKNKECSRTSSGRERSPFFSIILPMKDEEKVAGRILDALTRTDYPKDCYEILVVDDASRDGTGKVCRKFEEKFPNTVRYFRRDVSHGKSSALNHALGFAQGEIVGVFDADNMPYEDVLRRAAEHFEDTSLVALQGLLSSINAEQNTLTRFVHYEGVLHFNALYSGKERLGLFVPFAGTCLFIKRPVLEEVGGWQDGALSEDLELSARLTAEGYHVKFAPDVKSLQENPSKLRQLVKQRARWFRGCMEVAFKYGKLLKRFDRRGLDAEVFFTGPFVMVLVAATYIASLFSSIQPYSLGAASILTSSMTILTVITLFVLGTGLAYTHTPRRVSNLKWVPFIYLYWSTQVFVALYAFLQIILRRPRKWSKTSRSGVSTPPSGIEQHP